MAQRLAATLPAGFTESTVWSGLGTPIAIRFAPDGRAFVATKSGIIDVFDDLQDTTPTVFADLGERVDDFWDRGLLGMALDPGFTTGRPYVYVLYAYDKAPDSPTTPRWNDGCPTPPGPTDDGCVITGRLSRLSEDGTETVLIDDFCQQYPSHSVGTIDFGPDGMLYASAGDGASYEWADYGQGGNPANPCGDPPGGTLTPPAAQGGALRAQSFRRPTGQPAVLNGAILRVNPDTGAAAAGNPAIGNSDPQRRRIVAYGFRNPFRFTFRPGTGEIWAGDVGWNAWDEIDRVRDLAKVRNYGWPCYEGPDRTGPYDSLGLDSCETLYAQGPSAVTAPYFAYDHWSQIVPDDTCGTGSSAISGLAFYTGNAFPAAYRNALFFTDYARNCIWVMYPGTDGLPDPATLQTFVAGAAGPVFLTQGPDEALYYADIQGGTVRRIAANNGAPEARIAATQVSGLAPLTVDFDGTASSDPDGHPLRYAWDLDGDGAYDDSTQPTPSFTYSTAGRVTVRLRVTDPSALTGTATTTITVGAPPTVTIATPTAATTWAVGDRIAFAGSARNGDGSALDASALRWALDLRHCARADPTSCHTHTIEHFVGAASGSFVAPDHEYPSHLELSLTATDADGLTATRTVRLDPKTATVTLESVPAGLQLSFGSETLDAPFTRTVLARSTTTVSAPTPQTLDGVPYAWTAWSDGLEPTHFVTAPATGGATYSVAFQAPAALPAPVPVVETLAPPHSPPPSAPVGAWGFDETAGPTTRDASGHGNRGTLAGPLHTPAGRFGNALEFDGINDWVTVRSPRLSKALTIEAWVYAMRRGGSVALKETARGLAWGLYPAAAHVATGSERSARGAAAPLRRWTHVALTYDGATIRRYVNGVLAGSRPQTGRLPASSRPLRFGGNAVWPEWFRGRLDEIRVYERALTARQLQADMATPINPGARLGKAVRATGSKGATIKRYRARRTHVPKP